MILILNNKVGKKDNLSFDKEIKISLKKLNIPFIVVDTIKLIDFKKITGIIISGSSLKLTEIFKKGNFLDFNFNLYYLSKLDVPILGLCFGCQLLNILYGGILKDNKKFICNKIIFNEYDKTNPLLKNIETTEFNYCFSDIVISAKNMNIKKIATIKYNNKFYDVGFEFEKNKIYGILFHPEINPDTYFIFKNFYNICNKYKSKC